MVHTCDSRGGLELKLVERMGLTQQNKGDDGELSVPPFIHIVSPVQLQEGGGSGVPHKGGFQSHRGSIFASKPFMLCTSAAEPLATNPDLFTETHSRSS